MAIKSVRVKINNVWTTLSFNAQSGKYEGTIAAPNITSYNVNAGHYYPVTVEATNMADTVTTKDDTDSVLGSDLRLQVKEQTAPVITIYAPTEGAFLPTNTPTITFTVVDETNGSGVNISTLRIQMDNETPLTNISPGVTVSAITNGYSVSYVPQTGLSDGSHTVKVNCSDNDGNGASQRSVIFTVDTVAPTLTITAPAEDGSYVAVSSFTVAGVTNDAGSSIASVTITLNGVDQGSVIVNANGSFTKTVSLANGLNTLVITAADRAGQITSITRTIYLDTSAPAITAVSIVPNPVNTGTSFTISVTVT